MKKWRHRILTGLIVTVVVAACCLGYSYFVEPRRLVVTRKDIAIKGWDTAFDGLKIVAIGDIHGGSNNVTPEKLSQVVAAANAENADVIVLLGDYVSGESGAVPPRDSDLRMPMGEIADGLAGMKARYGVFAVLGNHDYWYANDAVAGELSRVGYRVLQNEVATIDKDGRRLRILGLKDVLQLSTRWTETSAMARRLLEGTGEGSIIVLEHSPDIMPAITGEYSISPDLKLVLASHTHGGQVWLPLIGSPVVPSMFGQKFARGHVLENGVDLFVTTGIGTSILPFRFMVPPEIAVLTIRST